MTIPKNRNWNFKHFKSTIRSNVLVCSTITLHYHGCRRTTIIQRRHRPPLSFSISLYLTDTHTHTHSQTLSLPSTLEPLSRSFPLLHHNWKSACLIFSIHYLIFIYSLNGFQSLLFWFNLWIMGINSWVCGFDFVGIVGCFIEWQNIKVVWFMLIALEEGEFGFKNIWVCWDLLQDLFSL